MSEALKQYRATIVPMNGFARQAEEVPVMAESLEAANDAAERAYGETHTVTRVRPVVEHG